MNGFKKFILRGNVIDLAVAVVVGASFQAVVTALVRDIITPIVGIFGGLPDFSSWFFTIGGSRFLIGDFVNAVIAFALLATVVYFLVVLPSETLMTRFKGAPPDAPVKMKDCPYCLSKVPEAATRCAYCTSELVPREPPRQPPVTVTLDGALGRIVGPALLLGKCMAKRVAGRQRVAERTKLLAG